MTTLDVSQIVTAHNDRLHFDRSALESLADAIRRQPATVPPPVVRPLGEGTYELVAGERRLRAIRDVLGRTTVDVVVAELDDAAARAVMLGENENRVQLDAFEQAAAYRRRMDADGLSIEQVAESIGRSAGFVRRRLYLLGCCAEVVDGVRAYALPIGAAERLGAAGLDGDHQRAALRVWIRTPKMTLDELGVLVAELVADQDQGTFELQVETWSPEELRRERRAAPPVVLGTHEVAELLQVPLATVRSWRARGQFCGADLVVNKLPAWHLATVQAWVASRR